jgi:hypothetical protein
MRGRPTPKRKRAAFIEALSKGFSVTSATKIANLPSKTAYHLKVSDPAFAAAWNEAIEVGLDLLEDEARRRALEGYDKPIIHNGQVVGHVKAYSDSLLRLLLRRHRPHKYVFGDDKKTKAGSSLTVVVRKLDDEDPVAE